MRIFRNLLLLPLFLALGGCSKEPEADSECVQVSFLVGVRSLHPQIGIDYPSAFVTKMLFEGLTRIGPHGKPTPALAKNYEISKDHKTYTFHLRNSTWSNGLPVTAHDFEYAWKKAVNPEGGSLGRDIFYPLKNARSIVQGKKPVDELGCRAIDDHTLEVTLEFPTPYFLEIAATPVFFPISKVCEEQNPRWANQDGERFVCNGPFFLDRHAIANEILVRKNPQYWDADTVKIPGIKIVIIKDTMTQLHLFEKKKLDWLGKPYSKIPLDALAQLKKQKKIEFSKNLGLYWCFFNTEAFPFHNKKMRQAFSYAINRKAITDYILQGGEMPATGVLPYSLATQSEPFFPDNNTEYAQQLFNEALGELGITRNELPEITLNFPDIQIRSKISAAMQEQWNKCFNIQVKLEPGEWRTHITKMEKGSFQIGGMAWQSWIRDPIFTMQIFRERNARSNFPKWEHEGYKKYLDLAEREIHPEKRRALFNRAEAILMEEMPVIPLYFTTIGYAKNEKLKNVFISDLYDLDFRWAYIEEN